MARFVETFARVLGDPEAAAPVLHRRWRARGRERAQDRLRLEVALERGARHRPRPRHEGAAPGAGVPRAQRLHDVPHQHRPGQGRALPEVRLAAHPVTGDQPARRRGRVAAAEAAALAAARAAFEPNPHDIACFIAEPIQGEGGDNHFRAVFLQAMQALCREFDALFILDEVQTGVGLTGTAWAYQQLGLEPDVVVVRQEDPGLRRDGRAVASTRCRTTSSRVASRINSTWGGNLTDMVRSRRILEVIEADGLIARAADARRAPAGELRDARRDAPRASPHPRGRGLMCAITLPTAALRDEVVRGCARTSTCSCSAAARPACGSARR